MWRIDSAAPLGVTMTERQAEILGFIRSFIEANKYPPTRKEIASHFGFKSVNAAYAHVRALERLGVIEVKAGISRGIVIKGE